MRTQEVVIPAALLAGDWRFIVAVDSRLDISETVEINNVTSAINLSQAPTELRLSL